MSYNDESNEQRAQQPPGGDPTEAYQATAEWDAPEQEAWDESADGAAWNESKPPVWEQTMMTWDPSAQEEWEPAA